MTAAVEAPARPAESVQPPTSGVRRVGTALAMVLAPWGFVVTNTSYAWAIRNGGSDATGADALALAGDYPIMLRVGLVAGMLGCLLLIPAVLGGKSEVLDLARTSRLFKPAQRKAMIIRDRECRAEGCTIPAAWCEAHHWRKPWAQGGTTDLADGVLLCGWHHHRAHDPKYDATRMPNGDFRFHRRT